MMHTLCNALQCNCNPECNGVFSPYAPFRGLGATPALGPVVCNGTAKETAIPTTLQL